MHQRALSYEVLLYCIMLHCVVLYRRAYLSSSRRPSWTRYIMSWFIADSFEKHVFYSELQLITPAGQQNLPPPAKAKQHEFTFVKTTKKLFAGINVIAFNSKPCSSAKLATHATSLIPQLPSLRALRDSSKPLLLSGIRRPFSANGP